ncbi:acetolactate synthase large subunit [Mycobacterium sp. CVI_P3]|uniref:acetolactate synthase n=1 Tax=Mycobacterium pinniadriaticum TaxID=2994102 RepID=A0ABT3SD41_9MYCO|nr:acetolactate synthase large subunit [Mycobacterium pinniadriaticum]MCX2930997.1 acetolactate synthase large subunit [Mycobacterium pinniadriaticum]MCX2937421.1 acetolactate synthase large subunit [Mycobacterium pinniadriaticum]
MTAPATVSDQIVAALADEGVEYVFGIPGDENLHFMEALRKDGRITFILFRHEQAAGFAAAAYGRLTGRLAVAMSTLGAGNLTTPVAHAYLAAMPMLVLTGQKAVRDNPMGQYQLVDVVDVMRPITKFAATIPSGRMAGAVVRQAMISALDGRQGPSHLELPEDVARDTDLSPFVPCSYGDVPLATQDSIDEAATLIRNATRPLIMVGGGTRANRPDVAVRALIDKTGIPFVSTMMGKGVADEDDARYLGCSIMPGDYPNCAVAAADVILNIGHDVMEKPTFFMTPQDGRTVIHLNPFAARGDSAYFPQTQVVGEMADSLRRLHDRLEPNSAWDHRGFLDVARAMRDSIGRASTDTSFPAKQGHLVATLRDFMADDDILSLDNGIHMMWATRNFNARRPNTMLIDHALGSMGISLPAAIAAKLVHPERRVVVLTGDGGFAMNSQDIETAVRLGLDLIVVVFNDNGLGMIAMKQKADGFANYGVAFGNPDFVEFARSYGATGHRLDDPARFRQLLDQAAQAGGMHIIDAPVDPHQNMALMQEMRSVDCGQLLAT